MNNMSSSETSSFLNRKRVNLYSNTNINSKRQPLSEKIENNTPQQHSPPSLPEPLKSSTKDNLFQVHTESTEVLQSHTNTNTQAMPVQKKMLPSFQQAYSSALYFNNILFNQVSFFTRLTVDLNNFTEITNNKNALLSQIKHNIKNEIKVLALTTLKEVCYNISFDYYGSLASGLSIETSDIDCLIKYDSTENITLLLLNKLSNVLHGNNHFSNVTPIPTAKVPVIKLEYNLNVLDNKEQQIITDTKVYTIHIDITFANVHNHKEQLPSIEIINIIKSNVDSCLIGKGIILFLKKFLTKYELNEYFKGGLSSFAIFILVFAYLKAFCRLGLYNVMNSGLIFHNLLRFYSAFNNEVFGVQMDYPFYFQLRDDAGLSWLTVIDPITKSNISGGSFNFSKVKELLGELVRRVYTKYQVYHMKNGVNIIDELLQDDISI